MIIDQIDGANKRATFEFSAGEWEVLVWVQANRGLPWFLQWMEAQMRIMAERRESELQGDLKRAWSQADASTRTQVKALLGL